MNLMPKWTQRAAVAAISVFSLALVSNSVHADEVDDADLSVGEFIDAKIKQSYEDNEIQPSPVATDEEWVRRVYLDIVGRIPTLDEVKKFTNDESPRKRAALVDELLESQDFVRKLSRPDNMTYIRMGNFFVF